MVLAKETGVQQSGPTKAVDKHEEKPKKPIENELVGISLGDNLGKILSSKGSPKEQNDQEFSKVLVYDGFVVTLEDDIVVKVSITGADISTPRGLKLDDQWDRISELYGPADYGTQTGDDSSGQWFSHYIMDGWEFVIQTSEEGFVWGIWIEKKKEGVPNSVEFRNRSIAPLVHFFDETPTDLAFACADSIVKFSFNCATIFTSADAG